MPNASLPTITLIFLNIGFIIGGAITVETVFSYPGLGLLTWNAITEQDLPLLQALFLLFSVSVIVFNIIADLVIAVVDPRIRRMTHRTIEPPAVRSPRSIAWKRRQTSTIRFVRTFASHRTGMLGVGILVFFVVVALTAP